MKHVIVIETYYLGPTNTLGARVVARTHTGFRRAIAWDHALDTDKNHLAALAALLIDKLDVPAVDMRKVTRGAGPHGAYIWTHPSRV